MSARSTDFGETQRAAAEQLIVDYARWADRKAGAEFAELFSENGRIEFDGQVIEGDGLAAFPTGGTRGTHVQGMAAFQPTEDGGVNAYSPFVYVRASGETTSGWYEDVLVPSGDGYRFQCRRIVVS